MTAVIKQGRAEGEILAPPSKSFAHRYIILAALTNGVSVINNVEKSEDILATLDCIRALGAEYSFCGNTMTVRGCFTKKEAEVLQSTAKTDGGTERINEFFCRDSGSTLRFFIPVALAVLGKAEFSGSKRLMERGAEVYFDVLSSHGANITVQNNKIRVCGKLNSGSYSVRGDVSSQYITGLILSLSLINGDSTLEVTGQEVSRSYVDITLKAVEQFGIPVQKLKENVFFIKGNRRPAASSVTVEGDWSNAAYLFAYNAIGGKINIQGLDYNSVQGDKICLELISRLCSGQAQIDISNCPDLAPMLFAVAAAKHGAMFTGTNRLKSKESDRAAVMCSELNKFGITAFESSNSVIIKKGALIAPSAPLNGHNDHRIVMALALLLSITGGSITNAEAVNKSFPRFFDVLNSINTF